MGKAALRSAAALMDIDVICGPEPSDRRVEDLARIRQAGVVHGDAVGRLRHGRSARAPHGSSAGLLTPDAAIAILGAYAAIALAAALIRVAHRDA